MFKLNFASHLGFPTPATPLFDEAVGSSDPLDQMRFVAARGFRAVQDPFAVARATDQQMLIGRAAAELGLHTGSFIFAPLSIARTPMWTEKSVASRARIADALDQAMAIAERIGSRHIAVFTGLAPRLPVQQQRRAFAANLAWAGEIVAAHGLTIGIEPVNSRRLPDMLLKHIEDGLNIINDVASPAVRLIFDFARVQAMDGDILCHLDLSWNAIEIIQIADNPDRVEADAGELNFELLIDELVARGFSGLCELEHRWSRPGQDVQTGYLKWLERWRA